MAKILSPRWSAEDYDVLIKAATETLSLDASPYQLLRVGQRAFPRHKQKTIEQMRGIVRGGNHGLAFAAALERAKAAGPINDKAKARSVERAQARKAQVSAVAHAKAKASKVLFLEDGTPNVALKRGAAEWPVYKNNGMIRWTDREVTTLTRRIDHWLTAQPNLIEKTLGTLFALAQEVELPVDRRRNHAILRQGDARSTGWNIRMLTRGRSLLWTIEKAPFDARRTSYDPPAAPPPEAAAPPPPDWTASRVVAQAAQEALQPAAAPLASPTPAGGVLEALAALLALPAQVDGLRLMVETGLALLETRMVLRIDGIAEQLRGEMARQITSGVATVVHDTIEKELGGPVAPPPAPAPVEAHAPPPDPPPAPPPSEPDDTEDPEEVAAMRRAAEVNDALIRGADLGRHRDTTLPQQQDKQPAATKPQVDVIGLFPRHQEQVRKAINGHADLRFIDPGHPQQWTHRCENVVIVPRGAGALAADRVRKAGVRPTVVNGGSTAVIHAIEDLIGISHSPQGAE